MSESESSFLVVKEKNALSSSSGNGKNKGNDIEKDDVELDSDILRKYLRTSSDKDESEHDRYSRAKADLTRAHEERMAKVCDLYLIYVKVGGFSCVIITL